MELFGFLVGGVVLAVAMVIALPMLLLHAWVFQIVWGWYAVEAFGQQPLTFQKALAVCMIAAAIRMKGASKSTNSAEELGSVLVSGLVGPFFFLGFAWLIHAIWF